MLVYFFSRDLLGSVKSARRGKLSIVILVVHIYESYFDGE